MEALRQRLTAMVPEGFRRRVREGRKRLRSFGDRAALLQWLWRQRLIHRRRVVLVWRTAAIGDIVCTLPICAELRRRHPGRPLVFLTHYLFRDIVKLSRAADMVFGIEHAYGTPSWLRAVTRFSFGAVEAIYEPTTEDERNAFTAGSPLHLVDDLAKSCGVVPQDRQPHLAVPRALIGQVQSRHGLRADVARGRMVIGINGGRTWPVREWDFAKWQVVVDALRTRYDALVLQFGLRGADPDGLTLTGVHDLVGALPAKELVALVASCRLIVSIDSGPIHLAGALGVPVVGLFGAVNPLLRLPPDSPAQAVVAGVPCLYCHHRTPIGHWKTGCPYEIRCMKLLEPEPVLALIDEVMKELNQTPATAVSR